MAWKSPKIEKPEKNKGIIAARICRPVNSPAYYAIDMTEYKWSITYGKMIWANSRNNIIYKPDFWLAIPVPPKIGYANKPKDCNHKWAENADNRFCSRCGTTQKLIIAKTWK